MGSIKELFKSFLRNALGVDVRWVRNIPPTGIQLTSLQIASSLREFNIDLVLDVGANTGQFASELRHWGYIGKIVSFEPLTTAHSALSLACADDAKWDAYPRCALGDHIGEVEINIAGNSESSSILPMLESHRSASPESEYKGKEIVPIKTLDAVAEPYLKEARAVFLKIDTQGFEWQVLDGARNILPHIKGVMVELSLLPLYDGQRLWREVTERLEAEGFILWTLKPAFTDQVSGRTFQVDGIFFRIA